MTWRERLDSRWTGIAIIVVIAIISNLWRMAQERKMDADPAYTIGVTLQASYIPGSGYTVPVLYYVENEEYRGRLLGSYGLKVPGGYCWVKYLPSNPQINDVLTDSVLSYEQMVEHWDELPRREEFSKDIN